jgi:hypothetical protein
MLTPSLNNIRFMICYSALPIQNTSSHRLSPFFSNYTEASTSHLKETWGKELNIEISDDLWGEALSRIPSCSINARYQLIQYKVVHRLHYSKTK